MSEPFGREPVCRYLGDGCYVEFDGFAFVLTTSNGVETTNRIVMEPEVFFNFLAFVTEASSLKKAVDKTSGEGRDE